MSQKKKSNENAGLALQARQTQIRCVFIREDDLLSEQTAEAGMDFPSPGILQSAFTRLPGEISY